MEQYVPVTHTHVAKEWDQPTMKLTINYAFSYWFTSQKLHISEVLPFILLTTHHPCLTSQFNWTCRVWLCECLGLIFTHLTTCLSIDVDLSRCALRFISFRIFRRWVWALWVFRWFREARLDSGGTERIAEHYAGWTDAMWVFIIIAS